MNICLNEVTLLFLVILFFIFRISYDDKKWGCFDLNATKYGIVMLEKCQQLDILIILSLPTQR